jgi:hypothetical protein
VSYAAITLCVASQRVFIVVYFVITSVGNYWIHPRRVHSDLYQCLDELAHVHLTLVITGYPVILSVRVGLIPGAIPNQKCHMNMEPLVSGYENVGTWNVACARGRGHVHSVVSASVALQLGNSAVGKTCSRTCRYTIKLRIYRSHFPMKNTWICIVTTGSATDNTNAAVE